MLDIGGWGFSEEVEEGFDDLVDPACSHQSFLSVLFLPDQTMPMTVLSAPTISTICSEEARPLATKNPPAAVRAWG